MVADLELIYDILGAAGSELLCALLTENTLVWTAATCHEAAEILVFGNERIVDGVIDKVTSRKRGLVDVDVLRVASDYHIPLFVTERHPEYIAEVFPAYYCLQ